VGGVLLLAAAAGLIALYGLARAGARLAVAEAPAALPLLLFAPLYALAYALAGLRGVRMFQWYLVPLVPFYALYIALGTAALARRMAWRGLPAIAFAALLGWELLALDLSRGQLDRATYPVGFSLQREQV